MQNINPSNIGSINRPALRKVALEYMQAGFAVERYERYDAATTIETIVVGDRAWQAYGASGHILRGDFEELGADSGRILRDDGVMVDLRGDIIEP